MFMFGLSQIEAETPINQPATFAHDRTVLLGDDPAQKEWVEQLIIDSYSIKKYRVVPSRSFFRIPESPFFFFAVPKSGY